MSVFSNRRDRPRGSRRLPDGPDQMPDRLRKVVRPAVWREGGALAPLKSVAPPRTDFGGAAARARGPLQRVRVRLGVGRHRAVDYARNLIR